MSKPELTKQLMADTLKKLASDKHLDKITISEIVNESGLNRQTFYYHFTDKQELICWIFDTEVAILTDKNNNNTLLDDVAEYIYSEKEFYTDALTSEVQNNLREHIYRVCHTRCLKKLLSILGSRQMDEKVLEVCARFFTHAIVGNFVQWAQEGMEINNMQFLEEYAPFINEQLVLFVERYAKDERI